MEELIAELMNRAGLSEAQAKAAAQVFADWLTHDAKRKKVLAAVVASTVSSAVVTGAF